MNKKIPYDHTGESWEVACHDNGDSIIRNGVLQGLTLKEALQVHAKEITGQDMKADEKFPLLIKFIDAKDKLSVQVHPEDAYAMINENGELGKSEAWYILDAKPGAKLIAGLKDKVSKEDFIEALEKKGELEHVLNEVEVHTGDVINIPAGFVHAIEDGILLAEIQQNSDTTYRVYDWNRVGLDGKSRELHVDKSLDVIDFEGKHAKEITKGLGIKKGENEIIYYVANGYFSLEQLNLKVPMTVTGNGKYRIYMCVDGEGKIIHDGENYPFTLGDTFMIPADMDSYIIEGKATLVQTYVPDIQMDVIDVLQSEGYTQKDIEASVRIG